jgi:hypothetical protein
MPVQAPPEHKNGHTAPPLTAALLAQCPIASQICGCAMLQRRAVGAQSTHVPPRQALAHGLAALTQLPLPSHVCETFPLHRVVPGLHTPPHAPALQTN